MNLIRNRKKYLLRVLRAIKNKASLKKLKIESINTVSSRCLMENYSSKSDSVSPIYLNGIQHKVSYLIPDIRIFDFKNVFCNINSASFIMEDMKSIYIEKFPFIKNEEANYSSGLIYSHNNRYARIKNFNKKNIRNYKNVLFLGGNGSFNFYHWMIEILPKILLINDSILKNNGIDTVLVNDFVEKNKNYLWLLEKCTSHLKNINISYVSQDEVVFIERLFFVNTFNQTVYNFKKMKEGYNVTTIYNNNALSLLKARLTESTKEKKIDEYSKVFILRNEEAVSQYNKRSYNQEEVFSFFRKEGFIGIYPEELTISEQINIFKNADFIVGPSGASWSNLIFSNSSTKAISWLPEQLKNFDTYSTIAYLYNINMRFIQYKTETKNFHSAYSIDLEEIATLYSNMV